MQNCLQSCCLSNARTESNADSPVVDIRSAAQFMLVNNTAELLARIEAEELARAKALADATQVTDLQQAQHLVHQNTEALYAGLAPPVPPVPPVPPSPHPHLRRQDLRSYACTLTQQQDTMEVDEEVDKAFDFDGLFPAPRWN